MDTSHDPTHGLVRALRPARLLEGSRAMRNRPYPVICDL